MCRRCNSPILLKVLRWWNRHSIGGDGRTQEEVSRSWHMTYNIIGLTNDASNETTSTVAHTHMHLLVAKVPSLDARLGSTGDGGWEGWVGCFLAGGEVEWGHFTDPPPLYSAVLHQQNSWQSQRDP